MNPRRTAAPSAEPLSLAEVKTHLRVEHTEEDTYLQTLIAVTRQTLEDRLDRTLVQTPWLLTADAFGPALRLPRAPVIAVQNLQYVAVDGVTATLAAQDYMLDNVSEPAYLVPAPGLAWPDTQAGRINAVTVAYTAGYGATAADVPAALRHWLLLAIGDLYAQRRAGAEKPTVPHHFVDGLLDPFRLFPV